MASRQLKLDLFPKKNWYTATRVRFDEDISDALPGEDSWTQPYIWGAYDKGYRTIWIDPDHEKEGATSGGGKRTKAATLGHEIAHFRLKHEGLGLYPGQERETTERFFEPLTDFSRALQDAGHKGLVDHRWGKVRDYVQELEVRILQETQGYAQDPGDSFSEYFEEVYGSSDEQYHKTGDPLDRLVPIEGAKQAINNLVKKGYINKKTAFKYLSQINRVVGRYK